MIIGNEFCLSPEEIDFSGDDIITLYIDEQEKDYAVIGLINFRKESYCALMPVVREEGKEEEIFFLHGRLKEGSLVLESVESEDLLKKIEKKFLKNIETFQ